MTIRSKFSKASQICSESHYVRLEAIVLKLTMSENDLDRLNQILPAYYVLASSDWTSTRNYIHERFDEGEVWADVLNENGLSVEDFDQYENWWDGPAGVAVLGSLKKQFMESILQAASSSSHKALERFLENHASWEDFIRELSQCTLADADATYGPLSYFAEYSIGQGLCNPAIDRPSFNQKMINREVESWFKNSYEIAQSILLSAYDEIAKVGLLK